MGVLGIEGRYFKRSPEPEHHTESVMRSFWLDQKSSGNLGADQGMTYEGCYSRNNFQVPAKECCSSDIMPATSHRHHGWRLWKWPSCPRPPQGKFCPATTSSLLSHSSWDRIPVFVTWGWSHIPARPDGKWASGFQPGEKRLHSLRQSSNTGQKLEKLLLPNPAVAAPLLWRWNMENKSSTHVGMTNHSSWWGLMQIVAVDALSRALVTDWASAGDSPISKPQPTAGTRAVTLGSRLAVLLLVLQGITLLFW